MYKLEEKIIDGCGNKVMFLSILKSRGYNIPSGIVIDFKEFLKIIDEQKLSFETIDKIVIPDGFVDMVLDTMPEAKKFVLRPSVKIEDNREFILKGKYDTYFNVHRNREEIADKIKRCFLSLYSEENLQFYRKNGIDINKVEMNVIIQEMIDSNMTGVIFSLNPVNGKERETVIEFSTNSSTMPQRVIYNTQTDEFVERPRKNILGDVTIKKIVEISLSLQDELGFPIEVEFGIYDSKLYIFGISVVTKINYKDVNYRYVRNSILDSCDILCPFTLSLDKDVYSTTFLSYIKSTNIIQENEILKPVAIDKFSRLYFNLDLIKKIFEKVPGYVERDIDEFLNANIDYLDEGKRNVEYNSKKISLFHNSKDVFDIVRKQIVDVRKFRATVTGQLLEIKEKSDANSILEAVHILGNVKNAYLWQTIALQMYKIYLNKDLMNILSKSEFNSLFGALEESSELNPYLYLWNLTRKVRKNAQAYKFFEDNLDAEIFYLYRKEPENEIINSTIRDFITKYGYHFFDKSDIINKTYKEDILRVIKMFRDVLDLSDGFDPNKDIEIESKAYNSALSKVKEMTKKNKEKNILLRIEFTRKLSGDKLVLKDLVLFSQSILRRMLLELGEKYKSKYFIENENDIFFIEYNDLVDIVNQEMKQKIAKNKMYYNSYRNYAADKDIYPSRENVIDMSANAIKGTCASSGKAKGKVIVINDIKDVRKIEDGDIIVANSIDQSVINKLEDKNISGIVVENSGMLSNIAIYARQNKIACVVEVKDVLQKIKDGSVIGVNGDTGEVFI